MLPRARSQLRTHSHTHPAHLAVGLVPAHLLAGALGPRALHTPRHTTLTPRMCVPRYCCLPCPSLPPCPSGRPWLVRQTILALGPIARQQVQGGKGCTSTSREPKVCTASKTWGMPTEIKCPGASYISTLSDLIIAHTSARCLLSPAPGRQAAVAELAGDRRGLSVRVPRHRTAR